MKYTLYKLNKTKIVFQNHCFIHVKLFRPTFNYLIFYAMIYFVQCILDHKSAINYDIAFNEIAYKYFLKAFYEKTNKKEYELQILEYNICYTNVIAM